MDLWNVRGWSTEDEDEVPALIDCASWLLARKVEEESEVRDFLSSGVGVASRVEVEDPNDLSMFVMLVRSCKPWIELL